MLNLEIQFAEPMTFTRPCTANSSASNTCNVQQTTRFGLALIRGAAIEPSWPYSLREQFKTDSIFAQ
jgi:hypothetical protein